MAIQVNYNPDVLSCLANLSNDEVFTPPVLANEILDCLPQHLFKSKDTTFLDPVTKSGVFLREIVKRLIVGLENEIPDLQTRINHIFKNQIYGIAITELTSLLARRSVYCSKTANNKYSICDNFSSKEGNILFDKILHSWEQGKCKYCGASQQVFDRDETMESYAYQFIHTENPNKIFGDKMRFDVIIGNPPYQMSDGGAQASASPIYQKFVQQAKKLQPRFISMIIPSRWFAGGKGLDSFREEMLNDKRIRILHDYLNAKECFGEVKLEGGVCYFLWDRDNAGECEIYSHKKDQDVSIMTRNLIFNQSDIFIRYNEAISILEKISKFKESNFSTIVSTQKPFGFRTFFHGSSNETQDSVKLFTNEGSAFVSKKDIKLNSQWIDSHKVYISMAYGMGAESPYQVLNRPFYGSPNSCCTETYLVIGPCKSKKEALNIINYIKTKFFRFFVLLRKNTQHASKSVYQFVPIQDFNEEWSDEKLYKKYKLSNDEISFIDSMIRPMETKDE